MSMLQIAALTGAPDSRYAEAARRLVRGAYDLHVHTSPSHFPRALDDFALIEEAEEIGMAGVLIKSHYEPTAARAEIVNRHSGKQVTAFGGVALNWPVGGLNPYAAQSALAMGAAVVWMPTRDAENCLRFGNMPGDFFTRPGITILEETGKIRPEVYAILETVRSYDACLATGHLSAEESARLCREGIAMGVRMVLTHPEWRRTTVPIETQIEMAQLGVLIEKNWYNAVDGSVSVEQLAAHLDALPCGSVFLATDRGQADGGRPAKEFLSALEHMLRCGVEEARLEAAVRLTPRLVLGPMGDGTERGRAAGERNG
ncbi:hypothetical protein KQI82_13695 [Oscillibacter sp. MSJ-2]|uniref:Cytosolic protein n=1 Tax=Dysosmobacter acutus TaxID=2841504 RepID=A0ABS6FCF4_9FIRM|nr:DUF6282 family protein [Dysosmobacter acutus]MBU5627960.1 hypothetical protein [Dysosmobacter acutus]